MKQIVNRKFTKTTKIISWDYITYKSKGIVLVFNKKFKPKGYIVYGNYGFEYRTRMNCTKPKFSSFISAKKVAEMLPKSYVFCYITY